MRGTCKKTALRFLRETVFFTKTLPLHLQTWS